MQDAYDRLTLDFDEENGGFGVHQNFQDPTTFYFYYGTMQERQKNALAMAEKTLTQMRLGGIYDQFGFGFHRYSTDEKWLVPHFEKMLYDQALMALAYVEAFQVTGAERYALAAKETLDYCCAIFRRLKAAFTRLKTPTPKAKKANSTCGP